MTRMTIPQAFEMAVGLQRGGRLREAESMYRQILAIDPNHADALHMLGTLAGLGGRPDVAVQLIGRAVALNPSSALYHNNLGEAYRQVGRAEEAIASYRKAIELRPDFPTPYSNLGRLLMDQGRAQEAVEVCGAAVRLEPLSATAHDHLGTALGAAGRYEEAELACSEALRLDPNYAAAHVNLATALTRRGRHREAVESLRRAIALQPNLALAHLNLAMELLLLGEWEEGWPEYEWRLKCEPPTLSPSASPLPGGAPGPFTQPRWGGEPPDGRTILLHPEQGLGDVIQFVRYAPLVAERGGWVVLACPPPLRRLMAAAAGVSQVISSGDPLPAFDVHCPLLSLPLVFGTRLDSIPAGVPYLRPDPQLVETWRQRLGGANHSSGSGSPSPHARSFGPGFPPTPHVGLVWAGNPRNTNDRARTMALSQLAPLATVPNVRFHSLQVGPPAEQALAPPPGLTVADWSGQLHDMAETAALVANLDLVVSVDTAVAHLAGALGKPVWMPLPFAPDWRWMLGREDSPWYPTMRLFRQPRPGDWGAVVAAMTDALARGLSPPGV